jgi:nucleoid-associated protein YgaU
MYATRLDFVQVQSRRPEPRASVWSRRFALGAFVLAALFGFGFAHVAQGTAPAAYETVVVQRGDTLWALAAERYPDQDVRAKVEEIERLNSLSGPGLQTGQTLKLPAS